MADSNYTQKALRQCFMALKSSEWRILLVHLDNPKDVRVRMYSPNALMRSGDYLQAKNSEGYNVIGRPTAMRHILVDDVDEGALLQMEIDGLLPALVIETSPGNYQAWITVSRGDITYQEATAAARLLVQRYGADIGAAKGNQLGRMPSFTNRKPKHRMANGYYPYARIVRAIHPRTAIGGPALLNEAKSSSHFVGFSTPLGGKCATDSLPDNVQISTLMTPEEWTEIFNGTRKELSSKGWLKDENDRSEVDFAIAKHLFRKYFGQIGDVAAVILYGSEKGRERGEDYAIRTAQRAWDSQFKSREVAQ